MWRWLALLVCYAVAAVHDAELSRQHIRELLAESSGVVDMHTHSTLSDGTDSPQDLIKKAYDKVQAVAISDHDQLGNDPKARRMAKDLDMELLFATEISTEWVWQFGPHPKWNGEKTKSSTTKHAEVHLLGYFDDFESEEGDTRFDELEVMLSDVRRKRDKRNGLIVATINTMKDHKGNLMTDVTMQDWIDEMDENTKTLGRPLIANVITAKGHVPSDAPDQRQYAFDHYLSDDALKLEPWAADFGAAVEAIDRAGGVAVLAHPITLKLDFPQFEQELEYMLEQGGSDGKKLPLTGMECYSSRHTNEVSAKYRDIAKKYGLLITGGSDYHGLNKETVSLGVFHKGDGSDEGAEGWKTVGWKQKGKLQDAIDNTILHLYNQMSSNVSSTYVHLTLFILFMVVTGGLIHILHSHVHSSKTDFFSRMLRSNPLLKWCCFAPIPIARAMPIPDTMDDESEDIEGQPDKRAFTTQAPPMDDNLAKFSVPVLLGCVLGLQVCYVSWGWLQEYIMTQRFPRADGTMTDEDRFTNSAFLVFCNRLSGLVLASIVVWKQAPHEHYSAPYKFSFASMANIMSSWFQYEALKYITFPVQVLAKSSKILLTMIMAKFMSNKHFELGEYGNALCIMAGLFAYKMGNVTGDTSNFDQASQPFFFLGLGLIGMYIIFDSFTSNWQAKIFQESKINSFQMMQGVNIFSASFSFIMIAMELPTILHFVSSHPSLMVYIVLMSLASALGQLFIFYTISRFGAVVFATAMTCRQIFSILLSIASFGHRVSTFSWCALMVVFACLIYRIWMKHQAKQRADAKRLTG